MKNVRPGFYVALLLVLFLATAMLGGCTTIEDRCAGSTDPQLCKALYRIQQQNEQIMFDRMMDRARTCSYGGPC